MITALTPTDGSNAVYTSRLGDEGGTTAKASIVLIQLVWPYVIDEVDAQRLAGTALTDFAGFDTDVHGDGIVDLECELLSVGELRMPLDGRR